jgi:hypothetical protein
MTEVAMMDNIEFKTYWVIAWSCGGGILYGVLFDQLSNFPQQFHLIRLENDVAGFKPKLFVGLVVLGVTSFGYLLVLLQTIIDFNGDWWLYIQAPFLHAGVIGTQSVI